MAEFLFEGLHHALAVAAFVHIDEVDDDDAAQIAQANLAHNLLDRVHVGFDDRVFEARGLAHVLAGIDVDGHQRLGLVDHNVAAAFQPHLRLERLVHLFFQAELLEQRCLLGVELHALDQSRLEAIEEAQNALVFWFCVNPDHGEVGRNLIAQHALDHVEIVIDQSRGLRSLGAGLDVIPQPLQEANVGPQFVFARVLRRGADDEAAVAVVALAHHDALQPLPLLIRCDLSRNPGMVHRRHVDQEPSRQRDVAGDARAFLADGFLGNLHQDFLALLEQIADLRNLLRLATREAATTSTASTPLPVEAGPRTWRPLRVTSRRRRSANLRPGVARPTGFCVKQSFRLRLGFFQFQFFGVFLALRCFCSRRNTGLG